MNNTSMPFIRPIFAAFLLFPNVFVMTAIADDFDREGKRGESYCFPAKYAIKTIEQLASIDADKKDIVEIIMQPKFKIYDGGALPEKYYLKPAGRDVEDGAKPVTPFTINADGSVPDFIEKVSRANNKDDICIDDKARAGLPEDDESLYFEMGLTPYFKNRSGTHTVQELLRGVKDGKSQYKKMIPAAIRMFMPDTDYLHVKYELPSTPPQITAYRGNVGSNVQSEFYNEGYVFALKDIRRLKAERVEITGGTYKLAPVPNIKTMKKFGIGRPRGPEKTDESTL